MLALYVKDNKVGRPIISVSQLLNLARSQFDLHANYVTAEIRFTSSSLCVILSRPYGS